MGILKKTRFIHLRNTYYNSFTKNLYYLNTYLGDAMGCYREREK